MNILVPYIEQNDEQAGKISLLSLGINEVVKKSVAYWKKEDTVIDDITIVLAILSSNPKQGVRTLHASSKAQSQPELRQKPNFYNLNG